VKESKKEQSKAYLGVVGGLLVVSFAMGCFAFYRYKSAERVLMADKIWISEITTWRDRCDAIKGLCDSYVTRLMNTCLKNLPNDVIKRTEFCANAEQYDDARVIKRICTKVSERPDPTPAEMKQSGFIERMNHRINHMSARSRRNACGDALKMVSSFCKARPLKSAIMAPSHVLFARRYSRTNSTLHVDARKSLPRGSFLHVFSKFEALGADPIQSRIDRGHTLAAAHLITKREIAQVLE